MKLSKEQKKLLVQKIKAEAKKEGYKVYAQNIYKKDGENFISMVFLFLQNKIGYDIRIKKYVYDDIFWEIMNMSSNSRERESLRVNGAFTSPSIILESNSIELSEDLDGLAKHLVMRIKEVVGDFLNKHTVAEYAIENAGNIFNGDELQCIAYVDMGEYERAKEIAKAAVRNGDGGGFENLGWTFFQWLLHYLRKRKVKNFFSNLWG